MGLGRRRNSFVVAREVTLLPRHWEWLRSQPGGASVALRKHVEATRKGQRGKAARSLRPAESRKGRAARSFTAD
jgi:uncharacterized protein